MKFKDITGERFGKLVATTYLGHSNWLCVCDCGNTKEVHISGLRSKTTSCGCKRSFTDAELGIHILLSRYKVKAAKRNIDFNLPYENFEKLVTSSCEFCGQIPSTPVIYKGRNLLVYTGIDRVDSSLDYNINNCASCCWICNRAKGELSIEQYRIWLKQAYIKQFIGKGM